MKKIYIAPSILSADLLQLEKQVNTVVDAGADLIHVDVMDGHFVPNLTFGPNIVKALKKITHIPLDVHLMIKHPEKYITSYAEAGADYLTVHQEASTHLHRTLQVIRKEGMKAGVALNPATCLSTIEYVMDAIDLLLIMTVNPGFGGQQFIHSTLKKIAKAQKMIHNSNQNILLEVDGGINKNTAEEVVQLGARVLVAGNAVFGVDNPAAALKEIRVKALQGLD